MLRATRRARRTGVGQSVGVLHEDNAFAIGGITREDCSFGCAAFELNRRLRAAGLPTPPLARLHEHSRAHVKKAEPVVSPRASRRVVSERTPARAYLECAFVTHEQQLLNRGHGEDIRHDA